MYFLVIHRENYCVLIFWLLLHQGKSIIKILLYKISTRLVYYLYMIRIGIVRGGQQQTFASSIAHGARVFAHLDTHEYERHDVLITVDGEWHLDGMPRSPEVIVQSLDVLYNALHESDPQNEVIDALIYKYDVRVVNTAHRLSHDYETVRVHTTEDGLFVPSLHTYTYTPLSKSAQVLHTYAEEVAFDIFKKVPPPWYVLGASTLRYESGVSAKSFHELVSAIKNVFSTHDHVYIADDQGGRDVFVFVVRNFRNTPLYAFLPIERVVTPEGDRYVLMRDKEHGEKIMTHAKKMHEEMHMGTHGLYHYAINKKGLFCIDVIYRPVFQEGGILEKSLEEHGISPTEFLSFVVGIA